jgi:peptide/nickel transport system substrate-binding protein
MDGSVMRRRGDLKRMLAAVGVVVCLAAAAACSGDGATNNADRTLVVAQSSDVLTLDPSVDTSPISLNVFKNIYDQLTNIARDGSVKPQLATSWESSADAKTWTFTIRTDATFHDGSKVTVDDVAWTFNMIRENTSSPVATYLTLVEEVTPVGEDKVKFTLSEPFAPFDRQMSLISILPQKVYEELGPKGFAQKPVGSGPYKFVEWVKDDHLQLKANPDYWGGKPPIKNVMVRPVPSESSRASGLETGELDIVPVLPPSSVQRLEGSDTVDIRRVASNRVLYLGFDTTNPVLTEPLRQAVDLAIDRQAITQQLLGGLGKPLGQIVAPVTFGFDESIEPTPYDPARAKELVASSGYDGQPIVFQYPNNRYAFGEEVAQAVAGYLEEVGIKVKLEGMEYEAFFPLWTGDKLHSMHMFAYGPSIMDAELPLGSLYESGGRGYWDTEEVDALIAEQRAETDPETRQELIGEIWQLSKEAVPYSILYNEIQAYGVSKDVAWEPRPDERLNLYEANFTSGE